MLKSKDEREKIKNIPLINLRENTVNIIKFEIFLVLLDTNTISSTIIFNEKLDSDFFSILAFYRNESPFYDKYAAP